MAIALIHGKDQRRIHNLKISPMKKKTKISFNALFEKFALRVTKATGSTPAFLMALGSVIIWIVTGPIFHYSENWQLVINTGTTIVTFLMVFLIQKAQNKDSLAIQLKLNELVAAHEFASNRLVNVEDMTEEEMKVIQKYYTHLSELNKTEGDLHKTHSIDEATAKSKLKQTIEKDIRDEFQK